MNSVFLNGEYIAAADAKISIFDRGFLFGDGVYEVLPVYKGKPFFVEKHIARLHSNLDKIKITMPDLDWEDLIHRLIKENGGGDLQIYIQITRGNQGVRKHDIPASITPSVIAFTLHNPYPSEIEKNQGLTAKLIDDIRWVRCDIKSTSLLANILLNDEALSNGFQTSILVRDGFITEGSTSNIFMVSPDGIIKTPPLNNLCLPGITRDIAIELMHTLNWEFREEALSVHELLNAQEVWISSTTKEIMPVLRINDLPINEGKVGSYWKTINQAYQQLID